MSPITWWIVGIVALIAILVVVYKKFDWFRDFVDTVFKGIRIAVEAVINWLKDNWPLILAILLGPFGLLVYGIAKYWDEIIEFVKGIPERIAAAGSAIWSWITDTWRAMRTRIDELVLAFVIWAAQLPGRVRSAAAGIWSWITDRWNDMRTAVSTRVSDFIAFVAGLPQRVRNAAFGMWDGIGSAFKGMLNNIIGWWNNLSFDLSIPVNSVTKFLRIAGLGFTLNTPNITPLAKGGVVMPSPGGTLALIGEAGRPERVEPLDPDGLSKRDKALISMMTGGTTGGGITINVNPSPGMDEVELASLVSRQLAFQLRAGSV
jgi:phage-related protein